MGSLVLLAQLDRVAEQFGNRVSGSVDRGVQTVSWWSGLLGWSCLGIFVVFLVALVLAFLRFEFLVRIREGSVGALEESGRFKMLIPPRITYLMPFFQKVIKIDLRIRELQIKEETRTKDNVFAHFLCTVPWGLEVELDEGKIDYKKLEGTVRKYLYCVANVQSLLERYVQDFLRAEVARRTLDECYNDKEAMEKSIQTHLREKVADFGIKISGVLIPSIDPDAKVKHAMNAIREKQLLFDATKFSADADKLAKTTNAKAEAEAAKHAGEGAANQQLEFAKGLANALGALTGEKTTKLCQKDALTLLLTLERLRTYQEIGKTGRMNAMFCPTDDKLRDEFVGIGAAVLAADPAIHDAQRADDADAATASVTAAKEAASEALEQAGDKAKSGASKVAALAEVVADKLDGTKLGDAAQRVAALASGESGAQESV